MSKQKPIKVDGVVTETLPNAHFKVKLDNGHELLAHISGKMRMHFIKILVGDKVAIADPPQTPVPIAIKLLNFQLILSKSENM